MSCHCGTCRFTQPVPDDLTAVTCFGVPPTPVLVPVMGPKGPIMQMQLLRPGMKRSEQGCSLHQPKTLEAANAATEVSE